MNVWAYFIWWALMPVSCNVVSWRLLLFVIIFLLIWPANHSFDQSFMTFNHYWLVGQITILKVYLYAWKHMVYVMWQVSQPYNMWFLFFLSIFCYDFECAPTLILGLHEEMGVCHWWSVLGHPHVSWLTAWLDVLPHRIDTTLQSVLRC